MSDRGRDRDRKRRAPGYVDATGGDREVSGSEVEAREEALPGARGEDFEADVERIHRPLYREARAPAEGREPVPWWLWAAAVALFWGGWYLGRFGGAFGIGTHIAYDAGLREYVEEEAGESFAEAVADPLERGAEVYAARCQSCHQADAGGVPGLFPPLDGAEWVTGPPAVPVLIVLNGLRGPIEVAGATYDGAMPAWRDVLTDAEIAAVVSYIRQVGTNDAAPVDGEYVASLREATRARREPWTIEELLRVVETGAVDAAPDAVRP